MSAPRISNRADMSFTKHLDTMTAAQWERLPEVLADLVNYDRQLVAVRQEPVVSLAAYRSLTKLRREARDAAHAKWGHVAKSLPDGTNPA